MSTINTAQRILEETQKAFQQNLRNPSLYAQILTAKAATDVYDAITKLQEKMAPNGLLRGLGRVRPLLDRLSEFSFVVEALLSPDSHLFALIWGPIKAILIDSSQDIRVFSKNVDMLAMIGDALPHFGEIAERFPTDGMLRELLALFYQELVEFYCIALVYLGRKSSGLDFDITWPDHKKNIDIVVSNLRRYSKLTTTEENLLDINEAREARNQSHKHFTQEESQHAREKYLALKARMSPDLYDRRLGFLRDRCVPRCAEWLLRDEKFSDWLDIRNMTLPWLWLQGIPGAGKTYLTATIIDHVREGHRALFALVTHMNTTSLTAFSTIQSLLFQAAEDDRGFQLILVETKERELQGNTKHVADLLKNFLLTAGATYIIIDGLDEMEEAERGILLTHLAEISKDCEALRLLICSRVEHDISERLKQTTSIRVDDRNYGSIQIYIDHRTRNLIASRQFDVDAESELFSLISPLSAKANGMFLYARIILDNLEQMSSIDEMRSELKALPNDLTEAYHRIFHRINTSTRGRRDRCRKILGWMGCATTPMTIFEMEHALAVDPNPENELHEPPSPLEKFNFVRRCGPIIEVVDEKLQFVHFTVQEYIFSTEIIDHINNADAVDDLCMTLLAYLGSGVLEMELDDEEITDNIVSGKYRLLEYAVFHWPKLIHQMNSNRRDYGKLLERLIGKGANFEFESHGTAKRHYRNEHLRKAIPDAYDMVCKTFQLHLDDRRWDWNWHNSDSWVNFDPLNTMQMLVRIQENFERLVSSSKRMASVQRHYGSGLFRCKHVFCWCNLRGFQMQKDRDAHITNHGRPWKCTIPDCDPFATIGFSSQSKRQDHWLKCHLHPTSQIGAALDNLESLDAAEAQPILFRLILEDRIDSVRTLLSAPGGRKLKAEVLVSARNLAIHEGSLEMTEALAPKEEKQVPQNILVSAVRREDINFAKWAISRAELEDWNKLMKAMLSIKSDEIYAIWEEHILTLRQLVETKYPLATQDPLDRLFRQTLFTEIRGNTKKEERVKHTLIELRGKLGQHLQGVILLRIAKSSCSISLIETLLSLGVYIDFSSDASHRMTALRIASKNKSREAALLMRYLLANGANPRHKGHDIGQEKGAKEIAQWVGSTWDELVAQTGHVRAGSHM